MCSGLVFTRVKTRMWYLGLNKEESMETVQTMPFADHKISFGSLDNLTRPAHECGPPKTRFIFKTMSKSNCSSTPPTNFLAKRSLPAEMILHLY